MNAADLPQARPQIPLLALKRAHSASAEKQSDEKRQILGASPYDEVVEDVCNTFWPLMYNCNDPKKVDYRKRFRGRNKLGEIDDNMELHIQAQLRSNHLARSFFIRVNLHSSTGVIHLPGVMTAFGIEQHATLECGPWTKPTLKAALARIVFPWLSFVNRFFSIESNASSLAPDQFS